MLGVRALSVPAPAGTQQITVLKLLRWVSTLTPPVLDLHHVPGVAYPPHAVAAETTLLGDQRVAQRILVGIVVVVAVRRLPMRREARRFGALGNRPHSLP